MFIKFIDQQLIISQVFFFNNQLLISKVLIDNIMKTFLIPI